MTRAAFRRRGIAVVLLASALFWGAGTGRAQDDTDVQEAFAAAIATLPALETTELDAWRAHVVPTTAETRYASVDWIPTFAEGLRRADAEGRPLLFWAMNGHPLGCT